MSESTRCDECRAIVEEIRRSGRGRSMSPKREEELRAHFGAMQAMQAGAGERVDELLAKFPFRSQHDPVRPPEALYSEPCNPAMFEAICKMLEHQALTGHKLTDLLFRK